MAKNKRAGLFQVIPRSIQKLNLNSNVVNQFPDTKGLPNLHYLDLSYNRIVGAPTENQVDPDNKLEEILLDENSLTTLPDLCLFPQLKKLALYANKIRILGKPISANYLLRVGSVTRLNQTGEQPDYIS